MAIRPRNSGFSLMEIVVVLAIIGAVGIGSTSMMANTIKVSQTNFIKGNIINFKNRLLAAIRKDTSWLITINRNAALNCLIEDDSVMCNDGAVVNNFDVYNSIVTDPVNGTLVYQASSATAGFDDNGQDCNGYTAAGNDDCPFRYDLTLTLNCPGAEAQCYKPDITIQATFRSSPATADTMVSRVDPTEYNFWMDRSQKLRYEPLEYHHRVTTNTGGGNCTTGARVARQIPTEAYDVGDNATSVNATTFRLLAGQYECEVFAQAYQAVRGYAIFLRVGGADTPIGSGFSSNGNSEFTMGKVDLTLAADTNISVMHFCGQSQNSFDMGRPAPTGPGGDFSGGFVHTRVTCVRTL